MITDRLGIPTNYNSVLYRSRLEAKWAAFFDLLHWEVQYEPFDLQGYIPDFVLSGTTFDDGQTLSDRKRVPILVEVKSIDSMDDPLFTETVRKIAASGWQHEALIVSYFLPDEGGLGVGWLGQFFGPEFGSEPCGDPDPTRDWEFAPFQVTGSWSKAAIGFCHSTQSFHDRVSGYYPGGQTGFGDENEIRHLWARAGNIVQWHPCSKPPRG